MDDNGKGNNSCALQYPLNFLMFSPSFVSANWHEAKFAEEFAQDFSEMALPQSNRIL